MKNVLVCTCDFSGYQELYVDGVLVRQDDTIYACDIAEHVIGVPAMVSNMSVIIPDGIDRYPERLDECRSWTNEDNFETRLHRLISRLRDASQGEIVWRVADKDTHDFCIEFTRHDSAFPESECREWLAKKMRVYPEQYHNMTVESRVVLTEKENMLREAADAIENLLDR